MDALRDAGGRWGAPVEGTLTGDAGIGADWLADRGSSAAPRIPTALLSCAVCGDELEHVLLAFGARRCPECTGLPVRRPRSLAAPIAAPPPLRAR